MMPDIDLGGGGLIVLAPDTLILLRVVKPLTAMEHYGVKHDVFRHALGQIGIHGPADRHVRKKRVGQQSIDTGAERKNGLQVRKLREQTGRRFPHAGIGDVRRIADAVGPEPDVAIRGKRTNRVSHGSGPRR